MPACPLVDCHTHTSFSDGHASFEDNVRAAAAAGCRVMVVCGENRPPRLTAYSFGNIGQIAATQPHLGANRTTILCHYLRIGSCGVGEIAPVIGLGRNNSAIAARHQPI